MRAAAPEGLALPHRAAIGFVGHGLLEKREQVLARELGRIAARCEVGHRVLIGRLLRRIVIIGAKVDESFLAHGGVVHGLGLGEGRDGEKQKGGEDRDYFHKRGLGAKVNRFA